MERVFQTPVFLFKMCTEYLSPISFAMLMRASPDAWRCRKRNFPWLTMEEFTMRRVEREIGIPKVVSDIRDGKIMLTGGFLLAVLNGKDTSVCQDIDFLGICPYAEDSVIVREPYGSLTGLIENVSDRVMNGKKLQFIQFLASVIDPISTYDFEFCRNRLGGGKLRVLNVSSILEETCFYDINLEYYKSYFEHMHANDLANVAGRIYLRLCKYVRRGYEVCIRQTNTKSTVWNSFWSDRIKGGRVIEYR